jgi:putative membrane protein
VEFTRGICRIPETKMKKTTQIICCAVLGFASTMMPSKAKAASDDDKKFLAMAAQSDQNEIALSQLAQQKATNPAVKAFGAKMVTEYTKMSESMKPFADSWGLTPPSGPDADHQKELDKLNGLSGADFDKEYISQMAVQCSLERLHVSNLSGHQELEGIDGSGIVSDRSRARIRSLPGLQPRCCSEGMEVNLANTSIQSNRLRSVLPNRTSGSPMLTVYINFLT